MDRPARARAADDESHSTRRSPRRGLRPVDEPPDEGDPGLVVEADPVATAAARVEEERRARTDRARVAETVHPRGPGLWLGAYVAAFLALAAVRALLQVAAFGLDPQANEVLRHLCSIGLLILAILVLATSIEVWGVARVADPVARYNLRQVLRLVAWALSGFLALSQLFVNWYAGIASLGLISLILGLALQDPLKSFFAWIYIMLRAPYRVGDRIKIGDATGDVINVGYLDTTLWEFGGPYLSTDHPSGRIIRFPNSLVMDETVYNYSWPLFPYVWNEIKFQVGYDSDLEFVGKTMQTIVEKELGHKMLARVSRYRSLLAQTPVDELAVQEKPTVVFRVNDNTWVEAIVRYVVHPRRAGQMKTRLIKKLLARLNEEPERVRFPKGDAR